MHRLRALRERRRKSCKIAFSGFQVLTLRIRSSTQPTMFDASVYPGPLAGGEAPEGYKAGCGCLVEGTVRVVGCEVHVIEGLRGGTAGDGAGSLIELEADGAGHGLLGLVDKSVEGGFQGGEPEAFVG